MFAAGRLSYSKVRAITRVVHPGNEAELVQTALVTTAAQLDRIVRAMRTATRQQVRDRHSRRALTWRWDDDGMLVLSVRLDPDEGAVALAALRAGQAPDPHPDDGAEPEETRTAGAASASAEAGSIRGSADRGRMPGGCDGAEVSRVTLVDSFSAIMTSYLGSRARDAADSDAFQVIVLADAVTLADAREGNVPPKGTDADGVEAAYESRFDVVRADRPGADDGTPGGVTDDGIPLPRDTISRIACTAAIVHARVATDGTPMDVGRKTRKVNASLRRALRIRDSGHCRFPGCVARRWLHAHHLRHWAHGGETALANLISLCPAHHWAVHEGGHRAWIDRSHRLRFARPDGRPLETAPRMGPAGPDSIGHEEISPDAIVPDWDGTPLDLDNAVLALLQPAYARTDPAGRPAA